MFTIDHPAAEQRRKALLKARAFARKQVEQRQREYIEFGYENDPTESWLKQLTYLDAIGAEIIVNMSMMARSLPPFWHTNNVEIWYQKSPFDEIV